MTARAWTSHLSLGLVLAFTILPGCGSDGGVATPSSEPPGQEAPLILSDEDTQDTLVRQLEQAPTAAELDQTIAAYGQCLSEGYKVRLRFRVDRYSGVQTDVEPEIGTELTPQQSMELEAHVGDCAKRTDLESVTNAYQRAFPINDSQSKSVADDYRSCVTGALPEPPDGIGDVATRDDVFRFNPTALASASPSASPAISECFATAIFGPELEF